MREQTTWKWGTNGDEARGTARKGRMVGGLAGRLSQQGWESDLELLGMLIVAACTVLMDHGSLGLHANTREIRGQDGPGMGLA